MYPSKIVQTSIFLHKIVVRKFYGKGYDEVSKHGLVRSI